MRTEAPALLPLFRSDGQGRLLARVYLDADRPAPLADLARELNLDKGGVTREADRLERAGLVRSERIGRQRLLRPNEESVYFSELYCLLLKAFGPQRLIGPALAEIPGVQAAYLFGSWAARYLGRPGSDPADIDVMVIGDPKRAGVARATRELTDRLGREVNATIVTRARWEQGADGFIRDVKRGPLVSLDLQRTNGIE